MKRISLLVIILSVTAGATARGGGGGGGQEPGPGHGAEGIPEEVVVAKMQAFQDFYNADETSRSAEIYKEEDILVTVNGDFFVGTTRAEVADFLDTLRNVYGGTNINFIVTNVCHQLSPDVANIHEDTWTADNGSGTCKAIWEKQDNGDWLIIADEITFVPNE